MKDSGPSWKQGPWALPSQKSRLAVLESIRWMQEQGSRRKWGIRFTDRRGNGMDKRNNTAEDLKAIIALVVWGEEE